jgi:hypothetical protein
MNSDDAKNLIRILLDIRTELIHYGGVEEAPAIWDKYVEHRTTLFKYFALPETAENYKLMDVPQVNNEVIGENLPRLDNDQRLGDFRQLKDILRETGIFITGDELVSNERKEQIVNRISRNLYNASKALHFSQPLSLLELLDYGKEMKLPANDLLLLLGFFNKPYQRFLINFVWYGGYCAADQVLKELKRAQEARYFCGFVDYSSNLLWEKQLGMDYLRASGYKFIDSFLWMERNIVCLISQNQ